MKQKKPPKPKPPPPLPNEEDLEAARKRKIIEATGRSGRGSTILSDAGTGPETLG